MDLLLQQCKLTPSQRYLVVNAINEGKQKFLEIKRLIPKTITDKYSASLQNDLINEAISEAVENDVLNNLIVTNHKSGSHPYIVVRDTVRNISSVICRLPRSRYIFTPSKYRGEFSQSNFDRLIQLGFSFEELVDENYQLTINLNNGDAHFGIIVYYDRYNDVVFEGALKPSQNDWIYKDDITEPPAENVIPLNPLTPTPSDDILLSVKNIFEMDEEIEVNLKTE